MPGKNRDGSQRDIPMGNGQGCEQAVGEEETQLANKHEELEKCKLKQQE